MKLRLTGQSKLPDVGSKISQVVISSQVPRAL